MLCLFSVMYDILAIVPHGNVKSDLVKFFSQFHDNFFPIFPVCIPLYGAESTAQANSRNKASTLCGADFTAQADSANKANTLCGAAISLKKLKPLFSGAKIQLDNFQIREFSCPNTEKKFLVAGLSVKSASFSDIPFLKDKNLFCPLGFYKFSNFEKATSLIQNFSQNQFDFKVFQLAHIRLNPQNIISQKEKSSKLTYLPTLSFSYTILESIWCK